VTVSRDQEFIRRQAKLLASKLRPALKWVDNFSLPELGTLQGVGSKWGPLFYIGILKAREGEGSYRIPQRNHYALIGILPPRADIDALYHYPLVMREVAKELAGPGAQVMETRNDVDQGRVGHMISMNTHSRTAELISLTWPYKD